MAMLHSIRRLHCDMLVAFAVVIEHASCRRLCNRGGVLCARLVAGFAEGLEVRSAAVVVVVVAAASRRAAEDGEDLDEEEADSGQAGTDVIVSKMVLLLFAYHRDLPHDTNANFNRTPHGHIVEFPTLVV
jgi:hypothetical protein